MIASKGALAVTVHASKTSPQREHGVHCKEHKKDEREHFELEIQWHSHR
jgi:hypothetical protein